MFDGVIRDLTDVRYVPQMKKSQLELWSRKGEGDVGEWNSQDHERVLGCDEGDQRQKLVLLEG